MSADARTWFTKNLELLLHQAGSPSYRELAAITAANLSGPNSVFEMARQVGLTPRPLARSTIHDLVAGRRTGAPDAWTLSMFVLACVCWGDQHGSPVLQDRSPAAVRRLLTQWKQRRTDYEDLLRTPAQENASRVIVWAGELPTSTEPMTLCVKQLSAEARHLMAAPGEVATRILSANPDAQVAMLIAEIGTEAAARRFLSVAPETAARAITCIDEELACRILNAMGGDRSGALLDYLDVEKRLLILSKATSDFTASALVGMRPETLGSTLASMPYSSSSRALAALSAPKSAELLQQIDNKTTSEVLNEMSPIEAARIISHMADYAVRYLKEGPSYRSSHILALMTGAELRQLIATSSVDVEEVIRILPANRRMGLVVEVEDDELAARLMESLPAYSSFPAKAGELMGPIRLAGLLVKYPNLGPLVFGNMADVKIAEVLSTLPVEEAADQLLEMRRTLPDFVNKSEMTRRAVNILAMMPSGHACAVEQRLPTRWKLLIDARRSDA
ncbi:magnesium transporter MgtE N-terminal domain-containing protein [Streptomyces europaeiscabiei]|uniref:magnesium transporter MgtE N-terminal domain-containing protein n=1 Tax=Streptomyces europaeiscabiei TaxID=146819 RepID=UPI0029B5E19D|nr:hypothetical protein [Streptomyces europaeiscabiei]MDX3585611.1 hypothetical protein [Streptomyces europaeiscabiei]